jgi:hypothetical protein
MVIKQRRRKKDIDYFPDETEVDEDIEEFPKWRDPFEE